MEAGLPLIKSLIERILAMEAGLPLIKSLIRENTGNGGGASTDQVTNQREYWQWRQVER